MELVGPNIAEISRRLKEPKESINYLFKSAIEKNGYVVMARLNRTALGLRDAYTLVDIAAQYAEKIEEVFTGMDDHWFLSGYYRTMPDGKFLLGFSLPEDHYDEVPTLLERMTDVGLITKVHKTLQFSWRRHGSMRADLFDFKHGRWEFDWTQIPPVVPFKPPVKSSRHPLDSLDIAILFDQMLNANTPLKEIAKKNRVSSKTAYRHAGHADDAGFVLGYGVNWTRTQINLALGKPHAPRHRFAMMWTFVSSVTPEEQARLSEQLGVLPFMWFEAGGENYMVEFAIPLEQMVETMSYLTEVLRPVAERSSTFFIDSAYSRGYSPPRFLVDDSRKDWIFDLDDQITRIKAQLKLTRGVTRTVA